MSKELLGKYIKQVDVRAKNSNIEFTLDDISGISSIYKEFQNTKANLVDVTIDSYKIVSYHQFAYNPNTARMGDKIPIALNKEKKDVLVSSIYPVFSVDEQKIVPEYLLMWFKRSEFDRYARFKSHGSAREIFDWDEMCNIELDIPSIDEQKRKVNQYNVINNRINILRKINDNLEDQAQAVIADRIAKSGSETTVDTLVTLFDNMRRPMSSLDRSGMERLYPYYGAAALMDYVDDYIFNGIYGLLGEDGTVMDKNGYPTMQYVWGKFWVNNHAHIFQGKNGYSTELVYLLLKKTVVRNAVTGAVQLKINQENLRNLPINVPCSDDLVELNRLIQAIFDSIRKNGDEITQLDVLKDTLLSKMSD